ncbi:aminotransferase [Maritimibacter sp. DP1N21-5]|uniref:aminotransferase n=1 Tax=Maritimibacter sp. DP1N21-5 TaxID=2836867 RepID=UPI001C4386E8|nr:aminotransferase [Maritimibacter sp. DP1N21-5]MBV7409576.1 aminotransferase [Maritimibacter sp. DP1N21-5]
MKLNPNLVATSASPVVEAKRWIAGKSFPADRPLLNVSQAAPIDPPPEALREVIARAAMDEPMAHVYGPVLGLPELRGEVARQFSKAYGGTITQDNVAITQGCNQAFCAAIATLCAPGDEVILPVPWYFNHQMWLDMAGVKTVPLPTGAELLPTVAEAEARITARTRAIVLVTPNNPCGVEYPADLVHAFAALARAHDLALILDETYRDFDSRPGAPHDLFQDPDWSDTLIQLYSFSKAYRLTGHRIGALIAAPARLVQVEKFLDTVAICPNQLGQRAALWGMQNLHDWLAGERAEILARRAAIEVGITRLPGWTLLGAGAYFAYVGHPFDEDATALAKRLVDEAQVLALPGSFFAPKGDAQAARQIRIAFANIDRGQIAMLMDRLASLA